MTQLFSNNAVSSLASGIDESALIVKLAPGGGDKFPVLNKDDFFLITVFEYLEKVEVKHEIMRCTVRNGDELHVERGEESTGRQKFDPGAIVELRLTAGAVLPVYRGALTTALNEAPIVSVPSASSLAITRLNANTIEVTGNVPIEAFEAGTAGMTRRTLFNPVGTGSIKHHLSTLALPGGEDIITHAGDIAEWLCMGDTRWMMTTYTRASGQPLVLPRASSDVLGAVKVGANVSIGVDGTLNAQAGAKVGDIVLSAAPKSIGDGWLEANGKVYLQSAYPELFGAIGIQPVAPNTKLPLMTGNGGLNPSTKFSPDGKYMISVADHDTPFTVVRHDGDTFTVITPLPDFRPLSATYVAFTPDSKYFVLGTREGIMFCRIDDGAFVPLPGPAGGSAAGKFGTFSGDGKTLIVGTDTGSVIIYKRDGETFSDPLLFKPPGVAFSWEYCAIGYDARYFYLGRASTGQLRSCMIDPATNQYTLTNSVTNVGLPPGGGAMTGMALSADEKYLAVSIGVAPNFNVFRVDPSKPGSATLVDMPPLSLGTSAGMGTTLGIAFSPDCNFLVVTHTTSPTFTLFKRDGDYFHKLPPLDNVHWPYNGGNNSPIFSPDSKYLLLSALTPVGVFVYKAVPRFDPAIEFQIPHVVAALGSIESSTTVKAYIKAKP